MSRRLIALVVALVVTGVLTRGATPDTPSSKSTGADTSETRSRGPKPEDGPAYFLTGAWEGIVEGPRPPRVLEFTEPPPPEDGAFEARAAFGVAGGPSFPLVTVITPDPDFGALGLTFRTPARYSLRAVTPYRLDGIVEERGARLPTIFWKKGAPRPARPTLAALAGAWAGRWRNGVRVRLEIRYIDAGAAAVRYEWTGQALDAQESIAPGWSWFLAEVDGDRTLAFVDRARAQRLTFRLSDDRNVLEETVTHRGIPVGTSLTRAAG